MRHSVRPLILLPSDPFSERVGGIHTFVKGFVKYAPDNFSIELIGATSDLRGRPLGRWQHLELDGRSVRYLPLIHTPRVNERERLPRALRYAIALLARRRWYETSGRILQFHRAGVPLALQHDPAPKIQVIHLDTSDVNVRRGESRWRVMPGAYHRVEALTLRKMDRIFVVNEAGVASSKERYPDIAHRVSFLPTWFDDEVFRPPAGSDGQAVARVWLGERARIPEHARIVLFAGRLELQKDPLLAVDAFASLARSDLDVVLVIAGDGELRKAVLEHTRAAGVAERTYFLGALSRPDLARLMQAADALFLTSAFEGMPIVVLEALATGLPVVATAVGEVPRLVISGTSGELIEGREVEALSAGLRAVLTRGRAAFAAGTTVTVEPYRAQKVLDVFYDAHAALAGRAH